MVKTAEITKIERSESTVRPRMKAAAYARVSMETEELSHSLSNQISFYSSLIQNNPEWEYAGVYADKFVSGTGIKHRDEFQRLIKDCEAGKIDIVLCKSISRMARNVIDLLSTVRHLKELGIAVCFEKENINTMTESGELVLSLLGFFAEEESRSISENTKWSIRKGFKEGKVPMHRIYGYKCIDGSYAIEPDEAETVRRIYDLYLNGYSCSEISKKLNDEGIKSCREKEFSTKAVAQILQNEKYTGCALLQKYYSTEPHTCRVNKGQLPMYYVENTHEAIISKEMFNAVQEEKKRRYGVEIRNGRAENMSFSEWDDEAREHWSEQCKVRALNHPKYELSTFIKCERCGEYLRRNRNRWMCVHHGKDEDKTEHDVPKAFPMRDDMLKGIISSVLEMEQFDVSVMRERLTHISATGDTLTFHFTDGHKKIRRYN